MYFVYNTVVRLCQCFCCGGKVNFVQIPYSHDRFSKISRTFFVKKLIPYKTYVRDYLFFLALYGSTTIQSRLFLKNIENFVWFPKQYLLGFFILQKQLLVFRTGLSCFSVKLFYSTLLALTDRQKDWRRNEYTRFAWAGGTFFPVVLLCRVNFWFWRETGFGLHTHVLRVQYSCGVVLVFWLRREIVFGVMYIHSVQYSCALVSVFWL